MNEILKQIRSRGFWEVKIQPVEFREDRIPTLTKCKDIVREAVVHITGWQYPYYGPGEQPQLFQEFIQQTCDWKFFLELWRYYRSGQFIHFFAVREDWPELSPSGTRASETGEVLWIEPAVYSLTEIYEFASRLAARGLLGDDCQISISLHGMKSRSLIWFNGMRVLRQDCRSVMDSIVLKESIPTTKLLAASPELAVEQATGLFHRFNWDLQPQTIKQLQTELLQKRR